MRLELIELLEIKRSHLCFELVCVIDRLKGYFDVLWIVAPFEQQRVQRAASCCLDQSSLSS